MIGVKKYRLSDLINVKHGFAFKGEYFSDEPTTDILLSPGNFKIGGGFKADKFKYYKGNFPKDYILKEGDIIITMTDLSKAGDTLGYSAKIPPHKGVNYLHNQRLGLVQFKNDDIDPDFLYWILRTQPYQYYIVGSATGSTVKHTSPTRICTYEFEAPIDKSKQQEIAQILTSLDDKIELNLQMNQTLEAMAQALFKEWFVNFNFPNFDGELENGLPKGWKECSMRDFGKIICGKTPSKAVDEYFGGEYMFIKIPDMHNSVFIIETTDSLTELGLNSQSNKTIPPYSICISSIATVGLVCINPEPCQTNQQINTIVPKNSFLKYYLYFLAISMKETFLATASGGTATLNMNTSQFSNLNAIMPSDEILKEFDEVVSPMMAKILENNYCNQALTQTRDTLLPKLMSGKLEIKK
jgi:type I restriction enzyme S subunit